jgi:hypothetical protein
VSERVIDEKLDQARGEAIDIALAKAKSGDPLLDPLGNSAERRCYNWDSRRLCFQQHQSETLSVAIVGCNTGEAQDAGQFEFVQYARSRLGPKELGGHAEFINEVLQSPAQVSLADDD